MRGGGGGGGAPKSYKDNGAPLSVTKIVEYCGVREGGHRGAKILQRHGASSPCHQDSYPANIFRRYVNIFFT